jgi:hypothetical protein
MFDKIDVTGLPDIDLVLIGAGVGISIFSSR